MAGKDLTASRLRELLHYDPASGSFTWLVSRGKAKVGALCGSKMVVGYLGTSVDGRQYRLHRLAFLAMTGTWPAGEVDHKDGNRLNNRWANLRDVTRLANGQNRTKPRANSASGILGATWDSQTKRWRSRIRVNGKYVSLGRYDTAEEASRAYLQAKRLVHPGWVPKIV